MLKGILMRWKSEWFDQDYCWGGGRPLGQCGCKNAWLLISFLRGYNVRENLKKKFAYRLDKKLALQFLGLLEEARRLIIRHFFFFKIKDNDSYESFYGFWIIHCSNVIMHNLTLNSIALGHVCDLCTWNNEAMPAYAIIKKISVKTISQAKFFQHGFFTFRNQ